MNRQSPASQKETDQCHPDVAAYIRSYGSGNPSLVAALSQHPEIVKDLRKSKLDISIPEVAASIEEDQAIIPCTNVSLISLKSGKVKGWSHSEWGDQFPVDLVLSEAKADDYHGLLLPGGVMNPDKLRTDDNAVRFVSAFVKAGKPVAAICHGPWLLVEADVVRGRNMTSWPSLKTDIKNAGGQWTDAEVIEDRGLITSRKPDDIPAFNRKFIEVLGREKTK